MNSVTNITNSILNSSNIHTALTEAVVPAKKDIDRAQAIPNVQAAERMAKLITDRAKLVRRAQAVKDNCPPEYYEPFVRRAQELGVNLEGDGELYTKAQLSKAVKSLNLSRLSTKLSEEFNTDSPEIFYDNLTDLRFELRTNNRIQVSCKVSNKPYSKVYNITEQENFVDTQALLCLDVILTDMLIDLVFEHKNDWKHLFD